MRLSFSTDSRYSTRSHQVIAPRIKRQGERDREEGISVIG
jgi:hypothetical protein